MDIVEFFVEGMTCDHCARSVEKALRGLPGVVSAQVAYEAGAGEAEVEPGTAFEAMQKAVRQAGYDLRPKGESSLQGNQRNPGAGGNASSPRHLVIIGAGSGAVAAALRATDLGARVTLVERGTLGGTCVNVGCVPSKILVRQGHQVHTVKAPPFSGIAPHSPEISPSLLAEERTRRVLELREEKYSRILRETPGVEVLTGEARMEGSRTVVVREGTGNERRLAADRILIATGSQPHVPEIPGLAQTPFWTSTEALFAKEIPRHLIVLGGGFVALEIGQAWRRLGAEVTLVIRGERILSKMEEDLGRDLGRYLEGEGVKIVPQATPSRVDHRNGTFSVTLSDGDTLTGDSLLVATGRHPNTRGLGLDSVGVRTNPAGEIVVDNRLETSVPGIFAAGDCTTLPKFVYVAAASGTRAATHMMGAGEDPLDLAVLPEVIFTDPQVARVGLTEEEAREKGYSPVARTLPFDKVPRALVNFDTRGWIRMVADERTGQLLGCTVLAPEGGEVVQSAAMALARGLTVQEIGRMFFPYLTMVESLKLCAQSFSKDVGRLSCCAG